MNPLFNSTYNQQINNNCYYNPIYYFNPQMYTNCQAQLRAYQHKQSEEVAKAAHALGDYIDAAKKVDNDHQLELLLSCSLVLLEKMG